jgi:hypothetical protein
MAFNDYDWRPITFQGVVFPPTLMAISVLVPVLVIADEELADWLWRLPICCGITKKAPAERCARCASKTAEMLLAKRQIVLDGIRHRLTSHGFDAERTYREWILALQRIAELSSAASGECCWSAPFHPRDRLKSEVEAKSMVEALTRGDKDRHISDGLAA